MRRATGLLCWGWLAAVLLTVIFLWGLGDRWWPGTLLLYGPRWPVLLPAPVLLVAALLVRPRLALAVGAGILICLGPILGFRTGWRGWLAAGAEAPVRVVTFNMRGASNPRASGTAAALVNLEPDLALIQECAPQVDVMASVPAGWTLHRTGSLCLISRWPVDSIEALEVLETRRDGMSGLAVHSLVRVAGHPLSLVNVHLETPRRGIEGFRWGGEVRSLALNIALRDAGSQRTANWIARTVPDAIIAGDFNLPVESVIFRRHWSRCRNAFSTVGRGFGYTRVLPKWSVRIDHILACGSPWRVIRARVGPELGSDHLPLIVDLGRR
jgi:endonuclease/exonuclease/phosphatase (EEP) superfamily protein YafD